MGNLLGSSITWAAPGTSASAVNTNASSWTIESMVASMWRGAVRGCSPGPRLGFSWRRFWYRYHYTYIWRPNPGVVFSPAQAPKAGRRSATGSEDGESELRRSLLKGSCHARDEDCLSHGPRAARLRLRDGTARRQVRPGRRGEGNHAAGRQHAVSLLAERPGRHGGAARSAALHHHRRGPPRGDRYAGQASRSHERRLRAVGSRQVL